MADGIAERPPTRLEVLLQDQNERLKILDEDVEDLRIVRAVLGVWSLLLAASIGIAFALSQDAGRLVLAAASVLAGVERLTSVGQLDIKKRARDRLKLIVDQASLDSRSGTAVDDVLHERTIAELRKFLSDYEGHA